MDTIMIAFDDTARIHRIIRRNSEKIFMLKLELEAARIELASVTAENSTLTASYNEAQQQLLEMASKEKRLEQELSHLSNTNLMLSWSSLHKGQDLNTLRSELSSLETKLQEQREELTLITMEAATVEGTNELLNAKVEKQNYDFLALSEQFDASIRAYQAELAAKTRLINLYREKCDDIVEYQREVTDAVADLKSTLEEATVEFAKLDKKAKVAELQHHKDIEMLTKVIDELKTSCDSLSFAQERETAQSKIERLEGDLARANAEISKFMREKGDLTHQVCHLLGIVEKRKIGSGRRSYDHTLLTFGSFGSIEELVSNNLQLVQLVRELSATVEQIERREARRIEVETAAISTQTEEDTRPSEADMEVLRVEIAAREEVIERIKREQLEPLSNEIRVSREENLRLSTQLESCRRNFEEDSVRSAATVAALEASLGHLQRQHSATSVRLSTTENQLASVTLENAKLVEIEAQQRTVIDEVEAKLGEEEKKSKEFENNSQREIHILESKVVELSGECGKLKMLLESEKTQAESAERNLRDQVENMSQQREKDLSTIAALQSSLEALAKKPTRDAITQATDTEAAQEIPKLKDTIAQLRKIGKRYREECAELKSQLANTAEELQAKSSELIDTQKKEESTKALLSKARGMITRLSEENEQLRDENERGAEKEPPQVSSPSSTSMKRKREESDELVESPKRSKTEEIQVSSGCCYPMGD